MNYFASLEIFMRQGTKSLDNHKWGISLEAILFAETKHQFFSTDAIRRTPLDTLSGPI